MSSEHSSNVGDQPDLHITDDRVSPAKLSDVVVNGKTKDLIVTNGSSCTNGATVKSTRTTSQVYVRGRSNGETNGTLQNGSPCSTARSQGSVDTELLLQDTETVMAAMEARMKRGKMQKESPGNDSDTDVSSTIGVVNGDDDFVKPSVYQSPRDALSKRSAKDSIGKSSSNGVSATTPVFSKRQIGRSYSQTMASKSKVASSPRSTTTVGKKSVVSDVLSRADSAADNDSVMSDLGSDMSDPSFARSGSKGKGPGNMSMTKPNRAFQLRRSRAESFEEPVTPRTAKSTGRSNMTGSSVRSSSVHSTVRRNTMDTHRSDASSLGAHIVRKSRENAGVRDSKSKANSNLVRADGGRHSLRLERATSLTLPQSNPGRRETTPKSQLKSSSGANNSRGSNLSVTGVGSSRNQPSSQPSSRSNTPKSAERMAWKRRKEYDPRRAVAEAKAKVGGATSTATASSATSSTTTTVTSRPKPSVNSNSKRRMIRSASFTNTAELSLNTKTAAALSHQELASAEHTEPEGFRRAFMPFHNSLRTNRSAYSEDEDDSILSTASTQVSSCVSLLFVFQGAVQG